MKNPSQGDSLKFLKFPSYAGPNTVRITEEATFGFEAYMVTNRSVIYGRIDGRGSAYKGSKMLFEIYRRLGTVEIEDQIAVTRHVSSISLPFLTRDFLAGGKCHCRRAVFLVFNSVILN